MAFGKNVEDIDSILAELAEMKGADLSEYLENEEEQSSEVPDGHLVAYLDECVKESADSSKDRRRLDQKLWEAHETEMEEMADKEAWQSQIILNKPFTTCLQAKSLVRRGLVDRPDYFSLAPMNDSNQDDDVKVKFWERSLRHWTNQNDSYVPYAISDATEMGFAVGLSMAIKVLWEPGPDGVYRLKFYLIEPWKTYPDPDRDPRRPWSGLYNIHEEWVDYHQLKAMEKSGEYTNIDRVHPGSDVTDGSGMSVGDREKERKRKGQSYYRNKYRSEVLLREFHGTILDSNGEIMMENARYTVANDVVIRKVSQNKIPKLRWPWVDFSPLPHMLKFHGYSIYEGSLPVWQFQNSLLNLYIDNENWRINNMFERHPDMLMDPSDDELYPGKKVDVKPGTPVGQALVPIMKNQSNIQDVQLLWQIATNLWEQGTMVSPIMKGEQPQGKVTAEEIRTTREMGVGVFNSIGKDIESGVTDLIWAMKEVLTTYWDDLSNPNYQGIFGEDKDLHYVAKLFSEMSPEERIEAMRLNNAVKVSGVSRLFEEEKVLGDIMAIANLAERPQFAPLAEVEEIFRAIAKHHNQERFAKTKDKVEAERKADEQQRMSEGVDEALSSALDVADKAMGVNLDAPGSTQQQIEQARGGMVNAEK